MKVLIILHGWQSSKEKWERVGDLLEKQGIKVVIPDIPGFKPETELSKAWELDDYVDWFKDFSQDKEKFFLLGHSFGARIGIKFAEKYFEKLNGLILVSAAGIKDNSFSKRFFGFLAKLVRKLRIEEMPFFQGLRKFFYCHILRRTDYFKTSGFLKQTIKNILDEDLLLLLPHISVPCLIVWGSKDKITPLKHGYLMNQKIKNSQLEILEDIGHTPHLENPELLAEKIKQFIL